MSSSYTLLPAAEYIKDMTDAINRSSRRVNMIALTISEDAATKGLITALCDASRRGVAVSIGFDLYFTYREIEKTSWRRGNLWGRLRLMRETTRRLKKSGAKVRWLGQYGFVIFARRTHTKWTIVDNSVYSFGGVNLYKQGIETIDYMFRADDAELADRIAKEHKRILSYDRHSQGYRSHLFGTARHTILIDGGKYLDSIIYRHALSYAKDASHISYISQYCPSGKLGRELKSHPSADLYFNNWQNADDPLNRAFLRWKTFWHGFQTRYKGSTYLHAKCMLFTMPNGKKVAITGSHNFVAGGAVMGTREVALETSDPEIISQIEDFLDKYVRS